MNKHTTLDTSPFSGKTLFLDASAVARLVQARGLSTLTVEIVSAIERAFVRWPEHQASARVANHSARGVIELMPSATPSRYAFKFVNGHPSNQALHGLPTVMAFGVLADVATGAPLMLADMTLLTAIRTAATSALVAKRLARKGSRVMALIGNGAQAEFQALAFGDLLGIDTLRLHDIDARATDKLAHNLQGSGLKVQRCASAREAVQGADIVTTATADKRRAAIITADMLQAGQHLNAIGGDCPGKTELHPEVLLRARVFVEHEPQTRVEGDLQQMPTDFAVTPVWRVVAGELPGRTSDDEITVFDSVGYALEDQATLECVHALALRMLSEQAREPVGTWVDLVARLADPKDLFAQVHAHARADVNADAGAVAIPPPEVLAPKQAAPTGGALRALGARRRGNDAVQSPVLSLFAARAESLRRAAG